MLKSGIPQEAVRHKMIMEGVSASDQALVLPSAKSPEKAGIESTEKRSDGPELVGFHWEPLKAEHQESMKHSIWSQMDSSDGKESLLLLHQHEFSSLSTLFAKKSATPVAAVPDEAPGVQRRVTRKGSLPKAIDMTRCVL